MAAIKVFQIGTFQQEFQTHGLVVFNDLDQNTPTTVSDIAVRTGIQQDLVRRIMLALESQTAAQREADENGVEFWFSAPRLAVTIVQLYQAGRNWLVEKDGASVEQMATDLNIHYGVAKRLAQFLQSEGLAKLVVQDA